MDRTFDLVALHTLLENLREVQLDGATDFADI